ncbi:hypothetical protein ABIA30_003626 [Mycobacterium sp. MAA66]|uniref:DUF7373 family lipoprotein n=1 Tax=Mycobacterium sp. MAA66 TaxID=3156297 RepID=UPI003517DE19
MLRRVARFSVALTAVAAVAACGGHPQSSPSSPGGSTTTTTTQKPPPPIIDPAHLQPGKYPTTPRPALGPAGDPALGATIDAHRLAGYVAGPWAVDSKLTQPFMSPVLVIDKADVLGQLGPGAVADAAGRHNFVDGFASTRDSADKVVLVNAVLQFAGPDDATKAAADMNTAATATQIRGGVPKPVAVPGHPETLASTYQVEAGGEQRASIRSFTAHGPLVLMQFAQDPRGLDPTNALVAKSIDTQLPLLDGFKPVDPGALAQVPIDPTGLLAMTLLTDASSPTKNAVYSGDGALHFQVDPIASAKTFKDNGITEVALGVTNVFQAKDPWSAVDVVNTFAKEVGAGAQPADAVPGLPLSKCVSMAEGKQSYCVAPAGNYAIEAHGKDLQDVHEQVAAQYILLTAKR